MDNSPISSSPELTAPSLKSVFKKTNNFYQAFEVSLDESVTAVQSNKSELDLDNTSSDAHKLVPFEKSRKSIQQAFNVTSEDSLVNSELEQSVSFAKPRPVFGKKNKSILDCFNVSFNETNASVQVDEFGQSIDDSNTVYNKTNPFKKKNESQSEILVQNESSVQVCPNENNESNVNLVSQQQITSELDEDEADSTTFVTKPNPFEVVKKQQSNSLNQLKLSVTEDNNSNENNTVVSENQSKTGMNDTDWNDEADSSIMRSRINPFKPSKGNSVISVTEERSNMTPENSKLLIDSKRASKKLSIDRNISKLTNNTSSFLEQSSINDENLNTWISDLSDEEMPPPRIPSVTDNLSPTKEKQTVPTSVTEETNPLSVWEQKLSEIISNAERKSQTKARTVLGTSQKANPFKKTEPNLEKHIEGEKKYKPPKLLKPAPFATKKMYDYIIKKLQPKFGIDTMIESENLVLSISDTVKKVTRRKTHQKNLIQNLKKEMAKAGLIETTMDFYEFIINFLPYSFRVKVVPCLQPVTNVVFPPKDVLNPFDKIL